jgi:uncharacterized repeat protein (TIGR01451 family)
VITNSATNVGYNNAQLNGSWIPGNTNNQLCRSYFVYGTNAYNLNRSTQSQEVYNNGTTAYNSSAAYGLNANTTYYYKAAVACIDGVKFGQLMSFRTLTQYVYKQTIKKVYIPAPVTKVIQSQNTITKAGYTNNTDLTNNLGGTVNVIAGNYMDLVIERLESVVVPGQNANYQIVYKNTSDKTLQNVSLRIILPENLSIVNSERGQFTAGGQNLILTMPVLNSLEEGRFVITTKVANNAIIGNEVVVNGYAQYSVNEAGRYTKDEVTAYAISQVANANTISNNANNNTNITTSTNTWLTKILGGNVIELGLLLIILTLFVAVLRYVWTAFGRSTMK